MLSRRVKVKFAKELSGHILIKSLLSLSIKNDSIEVPSSNNDEVRQVISETQQVFHELQDSRPFIFIFWAGQMHADKEEVI